MHGSNNNSSIGIGTTYSRVVTALLKYLVPVVVYRNAMLPPGNEAERSGGVLLVLLVRRNQTRHASKTHGGGALSA